MGAIAGSAPSGVGLVPVEDSDVAEGVPGGELPARHGDARERRTPYTVCRQRPVRVDQSFSVLSADAGAKCGRPRL